MTNTIQVKKPSELNSSLRKLWKFSLCLYIICNTAFSSKSVLMMLNSYAMYFFLGVSLLCIFVRGEIKFNLYTISMVVFLCILLLGDLYSNSFAALAYTYDYFVTFCIVFCVVNYISSEHDVEFVLKTLMWGGVVLDLYVLSIYGSGFIDAIVEQTRVGEVAGNANDVGLKSGFSAIIALFYFFKDKSKRPLYVTVCGITMFFAIITASKKVLIFLLLGILFMSFQNRKKQNVLISIRNFLIAIVLTALMILIVYNVKYFEYMRIRIDDFLNMIIKGEGGSGSDQKRMTFLIEGLRVFAHNPVFGDGTAASFTYFGTYSHSNIIEILMNHGIVGFSVYYLCYPFVFAKCWVSRKRRTDGVNLSSVCLFFYLSIVILSVALVYYVFVYYNLLLSVLAAYALNINTNRDEEKSALTTGYK